MTERPIIFNDAMSLAVIEDRKPVTRRPVIIAGAPARGAWWDHAGYKPSVRDGQVTWTLADGAPITDCTACAVPRPRVPCVPGDKLWVREAWRVSESTIGLCEYRCGGAAEPTIDPAYEYESVLRKWQHKTRGGKWAPSIHMPRWASRTLLDVIDVRVERLQDMTEEGARAEGFETRAAFCGTWDAIYPTMGMRHNPWVWAVRFKRQGGER